jgi:hypothetical protein
VLCASGLSRQTGSRTLPGNSKSKTVSAHISAPKEKNATRSARPNDFTFLFRLGESFIEKRTFRFCACKTDVPRLKIVSVHEAKEIA